MADHEHDLFRQLRDLLARPAAYPDRPRAVEIVETHISCVFLTDTFVYKLKKPVRFEFVDFSTLAARRHACEEEVRLNRRLARDIYLGVVPIMRDTAGRLALAGDGEAVEWVVQMRRLPADGMLDVRMRAHTVTERDVASLGTCSAISTPRPNRWRWNLRPTAVRSKRTFGRIAPICWPPPKVPTWPRYAAPMRHSFSFLPCTRQRSTRVSPRGASSTVTAICGPSMFA